MSSGDVGSSIQRGSNSRSRSIQAIASGTLQRWFASIAMLMSGPTTSRARRRRRTSSSMFAPTLSLIWLNPAVTACLESCASFSSE
jgi:hypothetical protein